MQEKPRPARRFVLRIKLAARFQRPERPAAPVQSRGMITFLINFLVVVLVLYLVYWALGHFGAPATVQQIVGVICVLILLLLVLNEFTGGRLAFWPRGDSVRVNVTP